jgi:hypothetical protein
MRPEGSTMNTEPGGLTIADTKDRHAGLVALGVLALGLKYGADAWMHFAGQEWTRILDVVGIALGLSAVILIVPILVWKIRHLTPEQRRVYFSDQSFTAAVLRKAHVASWASTVLVLLILEVVSRDLPRLPPAFFLQSTLAVMFASLAVSFLILDRVPGGRGSDA